MSGPTTAPTASTPPEPRFRHDVTVSLVRAAARDADVLFAARVSTQGEATLDRARSDDAATDRDRGLVNFLMRDRHGSPFEHTSMTFFVQAPIFVLRELMRHRTASFNEESGRYRELEPVFYVPAPDRHLVQVGKAGAYRHIAGTQAQSAMADAEARAVALDAYAAYRRLLDAGISREVARIVLPLSTYSSVYLTVNARALMSILSLRTQREGAAFPSFPQREIAMVAELLEAHLQRLMPITHAAFEANGRVSP